MLQKYDRETDTRNVIHELVSIWNTGVTNLLGPSGKLHELVNKIYYEHLAPGFSYWQDQGKFTEVEMLRYTATHIMEYLEEAEALEGSSGTNFLPPEFYICPPIRKTPSPGEITKVDDKYYITLSPACDLVQHDDGEGPYFNVERLVLAEVIPLKRDVFIDKDVKFHKNKDSGDKWRSFSESVKKNGKQRFHYLPKYSDIPEAVIDFKSIKNEKIKSFIEEHKPIATVSQLFLKDIQARFSSYFGRQGQPDGIWLR